MEWNTEEIKKIVEGSPVVVFGKGEKNMPMCGFSSRAYQVIESCGHPFEVVNIFRDENIRPALVSYSDFPTTPQIFIGGGTDRWIRHRHGTPRIRGTSKKDRSRSGSGITASGTPWKNRGELLSQPLTSSRCIGSG